MSRGRRIKAALLAASLFLMINLPLLTSLATAHRITTDGLDVTAEVLDTAARGSGSEARYLVSFRFPATVDATLRAQAVRVDRSTYDAARTQGTLAVRVLADQPTAFRAEGQIVGHTALWSTLVVDAVLAGLLLLLARTGRYSGRDTLRIEATADLRTDPVTDQITDQSTGQITDWGSDPAWSESEDGTWQALGSVEEITSHEVVLDLGDRRVVVVLDGHAADVALGDQVLARGRLLE